MIRSKANVNNTQSKAQITEIEIEGNQTVQKENFNQVRFHQNPMS